MTFWILSGVLMVSLMREVAMLILGEQRSLYAALLSPLMAAWLVQVKIQKQNYTLTLKV